MNPQEISIESFDYPLPDGRIARHPLAERDLAPDGDGRWLLETEVAGFAGVARFVAGLLDDVEIVDSPELKRYVADYFRRNAAVIGD